jgi:hypothetical protein
MNPCLIKCDINTSFVRYLFSFLQCLQGQQKHIDKSTNASSVPTYLSSRNRQMHLTLSYTHCKGAAHTSNFDPMTSTHKITNHVLDEIDLMSSFNFLLQVLQHVAQI